MSDFTFAREKRATSEFWRRRRDSNPRDPFESNGFQDRRFQPLTHSSVFNSNVFCELAANLPTLDCQLLQGLVGVNNATPERQKSNYVRHVVAPADSLQ